MLRVCKIIWSASIISSLLDISDTPTPLHILRLLHQPHLPHFPETLHKPFLSSRYFCFSSSCCNALSASSCICRMNVFTSVPINLPFSFSIKPRTTSYGVTLCCGPGFALNKAWMFFPLNMLTLVRLPIRKRLLNKLGHFRIGNVRTGNVHPKRDRVVLCLLHRCRGVAQGIRFRGFASSLLRPANSAPTNTAVAAIVPAFFSFICLPPLELNPISLVFIEI